MIMDTLRFSKRLQDKGYFSPEQADTLAETIGTVTSDALATKTDLSDLEHRTKAEFAALKTSVQAQIAELRTEVKTDIGELKSELLKWIIGAIGFQTLVIIGVVVTLARLNGK